MAKRKLLFLKIFAAELEDCLEDVEDLALLYERRYSRDEVTKYVFKENEALLSRELAGLRKTLDSIDTVNLDRYASVEDLASAVDDMIQKEVNEYEDPQAVYGIAKRKLLKVLRYIEES